jgi:integrase
MTNHLFDYLTNAKSLWFTRNRRRSASTKDSYWRFVGRYAKFLRDHHPEAGVTFEIPLLDDWVDFMEAKRLSAATIETHIVGCLQFARFACDHELIPRVHVPVTASVDMAPVVSEYGEILSKDELLTLYETPIKRGKPSWNSSRSRTISLRDAALIAIADDLPDCDLRALLRLNLEDVNFDFGSLRIREEWHRISSESIQRLKDFRASLPEPSDTLFTAYTGNPFTFADCLTMLISKARDYEVSVPNCIPCFGSLPVETRKVLREQRIKRFADLSPIRDTEVMRFVFWTACRPDEACQTQVNKVKWDLNAVEFAKTKSGHPQEMPIPDEFRPEFYAYVQSLPRHEPYVFFSETSDRIHRRYLHGLFRQHAIDCGITRLHVYPRMIRRTVSRWMRELGATEIEIDLFLRHSPSSLTKTHYSPVFASDIRPVLKHHPIRHMKSSNAQKTSVASSQAALV